MTDEEVPRPSLGNHFVGGAGGGQHTIITCISNHDPLAILGYTNCTNELETSRWALLICARRCEIALLPNAVSRFPNAAFACTAACPVARDSVKCGLRTRLTSSAAGPHTTKGDPFPTGNGMNASSLAMPHLHYGRCRLHSMALYWSLWGGHPWGRCLWDGPYKGLGHRRHWQRHWQIAITCGPPPFAYGRH